MCFRAKMRVFSIAAQMEVRTGRNSAHQRWFGSSMKCLMKLQYSPSSQFSACVFRQMLVSKQHRRFVMIQQTLCSLVNSRLEAHVLVFSHHPFSSKHTPVSFFTATKRSNNNHSRFLLKFEEIDYCTVFYSKDLNSPNWIVGSYEKIIFCYFLFQIANMESSQHLISKSNKCASSTHRWLSKCKLTVTSEQQFVYVFVCFLHWHRRCCFFQLQANEL